MTALFGISKMSLSFFICTEEILDRLFFPEVISFLKEIFVTGLYWFSGASAAKYY